MGLEILFGNQLSIFSGWSDIRNIFFLPFAVEVKWLAWCVWPQLSNGISERLWSLHNIVSLICLIDVAVFLQDSPWASSWMLKRCVIVRLQQQRKLCCKEKIYFQIKINLVYTPWEKVWIVQTVQLLELSRKGCKSFLQKHCHIFPVSLPFNTKQQNSLNVSFLYLSLAVYNSIYLHTDCSC